MERFKNRHIVAHFGKIARTGKACGTGTDYGNLFAVFLFGSLRLDTVFPCPVRYKAFQFSDRNRISLDAPDTFALALAFLGAYASADCGKCAGLADDLISRFNISRFNLLNKSGNINGNGATFYTLCVLTVNTSFGLAHGLFLIISKTYFFKVRGTFLCILLANRGLL